MPKAIVTASAVTTHASTLDISLNGRTSASLRAVLRYYRQCLTRIGFSTDAPFKTPAPKATQATLTLGRSNGTDVEVLIIAVMDNGTDRAFSVGGTVVKPSPFASGSSSPGASS